MSAEKRVAGQGAPFHRSNQMTKIDIPGLKSVCGLVEISLDVPDTGVAFRVGHEYVITAYHIFSNCIDQIATNIAFHKKRGKDISWPSEKFPKFKEGGTLNDDKDAILEYLKKDDYPAMKIEELIGKFKHVDEEGHKKMDAMLNDVWYSKVTVKCGKSYIRFSADIPFFDAINDVMILKIDKVFKPTGFFWLETEAATPQKVDVLGYQYDKDKKYDMATDADCEVYKPSGENLNRDIEKAKEFWRKTEKTLPVGSPVNLESEYTIPDATSGKLVLHTSHPFVEGTSGSPIVSIETVNERKRLVVHGMYVRGLPSFYYTVAGAIRSGGALTGEDSHLNRYRKIVKEHETMRETNDYKIPFRCFFEMGISMKKIASLLDDHQSCEKMKSDIFRTSVDDEMVKRMDKLVEEYEEELKRKKGSGQSVQQTGIKQEGNA